MKNPVAYIWWTIVEKIVSFCYDKVKLQNHKARMHHEKMLIKLDLLHIDALKAQEWSEGDRILKMREIEIDDYYFHSSKRIDRESKWWNRRYKARQRKTTAKYGKI